MRLQLLSDLHLETETVEIERADDAELLVLAGDIDATWGGLARFAGWPVPVVFVAGNHEYDGRDLALAVPALRRRCAELGITMLERDRLVVADRAGRRIRVLRTTRWSDFDVFGPARRAKAMRAGAYFAKVMDATVDGAPFDAERTRAEALACRAWLDDELRRTPGGDETWDRTLVVTHFAPSLRSADPRYGEQAATASFCNADDDLVARADVWLHGHLHCVHDYVVKKADGGTARVVSNARGHAWRGETLGHDPRRVVEV